MIASTFLKYTMFFVSNTTFFAITFFSNQSFMVSFSILLLSLEILMILFSLKTSVVLTKIFPLKNPYNTCEV